MSLVKAESDSMVSKPTANYKPEGGDPGKMGYSLIEATGEPATSNKEISSTKGAIGAENEGTSLDSYSYQNKDSADSK